MSVLTMFREKEVKEWLAGLGSTALEVVRSVRSNGIKDDVDSPLRRTQTCPIARLAQKKFGRKFGVNDLQVYELDEEGNRIYSVPTPAPVADAIRFYDSAR